MLKKKFNINRYVYFKPTEYGLELMNERLNIDRHEIDPESGLYYLQLHTFMRCFGAYSFVGNDNFIVESTIYMNENDIKD